MMGDDERVWFITGSSSGFGRRLINAVLARGDRVIATARHLDKTQDIADKADPSRLRFLQLDVASGYEDIKAIVETAISIWGRIDVLVNNAGFAMPAILEEAGIEGAMHQFNTNYFGIVKVTTAVLPHMRERTSRTIVIIGSRSAWKADIPGVGHYAASKAAVHAFGETLAAEVASFSIRVLIVAPGIFRTEGIYTAAPFQGNRVESYDALRDVVSTRLSTLNRRWTNIGDPAKAMNVVVDVVRGEGQAKGRDWPLFLVLGEDAENDIKAHGQRIVGLMEDWKDVSRNTKMDE